MERLLGELKKPEISPWRKLRNFIVKSLPGFDATSWRRLQRRLIVRRIGVPGRVAVGAGKVGVIVDTSGSIGQDVLNVFGGHMASIIEDAMPELLRVYWVDARVHRIDDVKNGTQLRALLAKPVPGGGGTDMRKGIQAAEIDKCDAIVVLTDGYTPFCGSTKPLMWAITSHNIKAPSGTTIHI
jgi:predicted metal-dependent peptidase